MSCACEHPQESFNPRHRDVCVKCGHRLASPEWTANDATVKEFFDRLAFSPLPDFAAFREHCQTREIAGREKFGFKYLSRDNPVEAMEEAADGANYAFFDTLVARREGDETPEREALAYAAAEHFARAHHALRMLQRT